jgi:hypothetical protein
MLVLWARWSLLGRGDAEGSTNSWTYLALIIFLVAPGAVVAHVSALNPLRVDCSLQEGTTAASIREACSQFEAPLWMLLVLCVVGGLLTRSRDAADSRREAPDDSTAGGSTVAGDQRLGRNPQAMTAMLNQEARRRAGLPAKTLHPTNEHPREHDAFQEEPPDF